MKNYTITIFLIIITFVILGYNRDNYHSQSPVEYIISNVEGIDDSPKGVFRRAWRLIKNNYVDETCNHQDWNRWKKRYEKNIETYTDAHIAIETMLESLDDPYTRFLTKEDFEEQDMNIDARLQGIGVHITELDGKILIISVIDESPAQNYGLKDKDEIVKIDSTPVKGLPLKNVAELIRGEQGTSVKLTILRNDKTLIKNIKREEIKIKTVKSKMLDNNIAYIRISSFISMDTANEFKNALESLKTADGLVIDVRGNYGGLLTNAVYISNMFLDKGNIVSIVNRNGDKQDFTAVPEDVITQKPAVILIDEASASASEIFSGAMKDHKRAALVGETTFGKGKVQMILKLPDDSGINLTVAKYLTPSGTDIDHKGVRPDYMVENEADEQKNDDDVCLNKAVEILLKENKK